MSDIDEEKFKDKKAVGRLSGKTTTHTNSLLITDPKIDRTNYFVIYGQADDGEEEKPYFILSIIEMWTDKKGMMAKVQTLGDRPKRPFEVGAEVYLATEEQISKILGISNPPDESVALGKLLGYPFEVFLAVKNFGRIFITGKSGSGKSYTMGVLCEEFLRKGIPVVILDRHGEYGSLKVAGDDDDSAVKVEPKIIPVGDDLVDFGDIESELDELETPPPKQKTDGPGESEYVDNIIEFADLTKNKGGDIDLDYLFSLDPKDLVAPRLCTIVNLRGLDLEIQEIIAGKLLKKLYNASTSREIPPFYLFLDEAHLFAGKKQTETCDVVKLFAQEGRKFGANIVIGTQRPQLLDTTIRAQAGTWIVMNLSDVRDIGITISSAEDLSKENKDDISGLDKGECIICGEAVAGIPLFVKVRKRNTKHGGIGFNPLDFLSEQTVDELQKRKNRILGNKTDEELEAGKETFQEITGASTTTDYVTLIMQLKTRIKELEAENATLKQGGGQAGGESAIPFLSGDSSEHIKELEMQVKVWKEKYNALKGRGGTETPVALEPLPSVATSNPSADNSGLILEFENKISALEGEVQKYKTKAKEGVALADKLMTELKKYKK